MDCVKKIPVQINKELQEVFSWKAHTPFIDTQAVTHPSCLDFYHFIQQIPVRILSDVPYIFNIRNTDLVYLYSNSQSAHFPYGRRVWLLCPFTLVCAHWGWWLWAPALPPAQHCPMPPCPMEAAQDAKGSNIFMDSTVATSCAIYISQNILIFRNSIL